MHKTEMDAYLSMAYLLAIIIIITGILFWGLKRCFKLSQRRARKIEITGYYLLFIVLVWEFIIKNLLMDSFYNADLWYIDQKLDYIFQAINRITENGADIPIGILDEFYNIQSAEFVEKQLFFVNIVESILKITSTAFIAVGRFYELEKMKEEEIGENYVQK